MTFTNFADRICDAAYDPCGTILGPGEYDIEIDLRFFWQSNSNNGAFVYFFNDLNGNLAFDDSNNELRAAFGTSHVISSDAGGGILANTPYVRFDEYDNGVRVSKLGAPLTGIASSGDIIRIRLSARPTANGGEGLATLSVMNLTAGDSAFTALPELTDVSMGLADAGSIDGIVLRIDAFPHPPAGVEGSAINTIRIFARSCGPADLAAPFGELTFADISAFLAAFTANEPVADLADPLGQFTFADISAFLAAFSAGCP